MNTEKPPKKVVYLLGAGASHACVSSVESSLGILMGDLGGELCNRLRDLIQNDFSEDRRLVNLVNEVVTETTDFEHIITFLGDAPSSSHRQFAEEVRKAFAIVLRERLNSIREENQGSEIGLYKVLLDIYNIPSYHEVLQGIITINYDEYIEEAIEEIGRCQIDFGIEVEPLSDKPESLRLLKLHGSLGWRDTWPISRGQDTVPTLWIPPGIQKVKHAYPFNLLWGLAREMLSCDVLRIIGCRLGANDWDLISLLFTMCHANFATSPQIEVIDAPIHVAHMKEMHPYLELLSILEIEHIGSQFVAALTTGPPQDFAEFSREKQKGIIESAGTRENWFELWLREKVESIQIDLGTVSTDLNLVSDFLNA